mgnify:CR=1 FL=1
MTFNKRVVTFLDNTSKAFWKGFTFEERFTVKELRNLCDEYEILGCTDVLYEEYNPLATDDDGSCITLSLNGCTDISACNYCQDCVVIDNDLCQYPNLGYNCNGQCLDDADADGICDEFEILGCTDFNAANYNNLATNDDGSCEYTIYGCTDPTADNYNADANTDNGSCYYSCPDGQAQVDILVTTDTYSGSENAFTLCDHLSAA